MKKKEKSICGYVCVCVIVCCVRKDKSPSEKGRLGGRREKRESDSSKRGKAALLAVLLDEREGEKEVNDFASECHSLEELSSLLLLLLFVEKRQYIDQQWS